MTNLHYKAMQKPHTSETNTTIKTNTNTLIFPGNITPLTTLNKIPKQINNKTIKQKK